MSIEENQALQRQLYGEPLAQIAGHIRSELNLTQAALADTLGLSAPMLSQLLSGQRAKIGNPAVLGRLQALVGLAERASTLTAAERNAQLEAIKETTPTASTMIRPAATALRSLAPAEELERLANLTTSPDLAKLLRSAVRDG